MSERSAPKNSKDQVSTSEVLPPHFSRDEIGIHNDISPSLLDEMAKAKSELSKAKKSAQELALHVVESRVRTRATRKEIANLKKSITCEEKWGLNNDEASNYQYTKMIRELQNAKQELSNMKLDMAFAFRIKEKAEEEAKELKWKIGTYLNSKEELEKEVEATNEEHVFVELARIEASRECRQIKARMMSEANRFSRKIETARARMKDLNNEVKRVEELEMKLAITTSDLDVLQKEMVLVRAMRENLAVGKSGSHGKNKWENELRATKSELETMKKELASIKEQGFRNMSSMDFLREEKNNVSDEIFQMKILEEKTDITVQNLNTKLLKARSELETAIAAEEKSKMIMIKLSKSMQSLNVKKEEPEKHYKQIMEEAESFKIKTKNDESSILVAKERLLAAMQELEELKKSEANSLERLKILSENTMTHRASTLHNKKTITISKSEYNYLHNCAEGAQELAEKKVEASLAWIATLKASEKEYLLEKGIVQNKIKGIEESEEHEIHKLGELLMKLKLTEQKGKNERGFNLVKSLLKVKPPRTSFKESRVSRSSRISRVSRSSRIYMVTVEETREPFDTKELENDPAKLQLLVSQARKSFKGNTTRKSNVRRRTSLSGVRTSMGTPSVIFRKNKVLPNFIRFLRETKASKQKLIN